MRNSVRIALLACVLAAPGAWAQIYKWVDEQGRVQYGDKPPAGVKATPVGVDPPASGGPAAKEPDWKQKDLDFQRRKIERDKAEAAQATKDAELRERLAKDCAYARDELKALEAQIPIYDFDKQGSKFFIDDAERSRRTTRYRTYLADNCR